MEFDPVEPSDLTKLAVHVFRQALEDYIHLQHPSTRVKKYVHEAFLSSVDMFWNPEYRIDSFLDENQEPMDFETFLMLAADRSNLNLEAFIKYIQTESEKYWKDKHMNTIVIPDVMMICNTPYYTSHREEESYSVDYDERIVFLNKHSTEQNNIRFCAAILEIICYHQDLRISKVVQRELGQKFYEALKMNNSFKEIKPQKQSALIPEQS